MLRCPEECGKQWRPKQGKPGQQKEEKKEEEGKNQEEKKQKKQKKRTMEVKKVVEEQEIWDEEEEVAKSKEEARKLVPQRFHKWIYVFRKKESERMPIKVWNYVIEVNKGFVLKMRKMYLLLKEERD